MDKIFRLYFLDIEENRIMVTEFDLILSNTLVLKANFLMGLRTLGTFAI